MYTYRYPRCVVRFGMNMEDLNRSDASAKSIGKALRAVEHQLAIRSENDVASKALRRAFYDLLDKSSTSIFDAIADAASRGHRAFHPASIPAFKSGCETVFGFGGGVFDPELLNDWLRRRDLSHVFRADQGVITW